MAEPVPPALATARRGLFELYRERNASVWLEATGSSMLPSIRQGTSLLVDFGARRVGLGEIAIFPLGRTIVAHRVVRLRPGPDGDLLLCKGDARLEFDPPVPAREVLGAVRALRHDESGAAETAVCSGPRAVRLARISAAIGDATTLARRAPRPLRRPALKLAHVSMRLVRAKSSARRRGG